MTSECRRCGKPERGYDVRFSYATRRFEPTRFQSRPGRFCQPCAVEAAREKNREHNAARQARHGEVRHLVKDGKKVDGKKVDELEGSDASNTASQERAQENVR